MQKSAKSITQNPDLLTELTETEMASTTGGLLSGQQLTGWLKDYKAGTLDYASVYQTIQNESPADMQDDIGIARRWFRHLSPKNKSIVRSLYSQVKGYLQT